MLSFASHLSASGTHCSLQIIFIIDHIYAPGSPHPQGYNLQDAPTNPLMTMNDCAHPAILTSLPLPLPSSPDPTQPQITSGPLKKRTPKSPYAPTPGVLEPEQSTTLFPVPRVAEACTSAFPHASSVTLRPAAVEGYRKCLRNPHAGPNRPSRARTLSLRASIACMQSWLWHRAFDSTHSEERPVAWHLQTRTIRRPVSGPFVPPSTLPRRSKRVYSCPLPTAGLIALSAT